MRSDIEQKIISTDQKYLKKFIGREMPERLEQQLEHLDWNYVDILHKSPRERGTFAPLGAMELAEIRHHEAEYRKVGLEAIRAGYVSYVICTRAILSGVHYEDGVAIRRTATENNITMFTSLDTVKVLLDVLEEMTIGISTIDA